MNAEKENPYVIIGKYTRHDHYGHPLYEGSCKFCTYRSDSHVNVISHCKGKHPAKYKKHMKLSVTNNKSIKSFFNITKEKTIAQKSKEEINKYIFSSYDQKYILPICSLTKYEIYIIEMIVDTNMSIHSVEKDTFQVILSSLKEKVTMKRGKARKLILEYSKFLKKSIMHQFFKLKPIITLLIDGGKNNDMKTYVLLLQHIDKVLFGKVLNIDDG